MRTPQGLHENLVWTYRDPFDECAKIEDLLCFYNECVEALTDDGKPGLASK